MKNILKKFVVKILTLQARTVLWRRQPKIVVISGSVGKTSTKDAVAAALGVSFSVRKSEKSFNSDIGVPLTILNLKNAWGNALLWALNIIKGDWEIIRPGPYPEWLVLEVGADKPGDLSQIFSWLKPDVAVMTRLPEVPVHVEFYNSPEALREEESIPVYKLKDGGLVVLNFDDENIRAIKEKVRGKITTYGTIIGANVLGSSYSIRYGKIDGVRTVQGMGFRLDTGGNSVPFEINGALGVQHLYPVLAATAVALEYGVNLVKLSEAFKKHQTPPGRMKIVEGIKKTIIIDDTYNSSPVALSEAIRTVASIEGFSRKIAVLGDMLELGKFSEGEHKKAGALAAKTVDMIVTVGPRARGIASGALEVGYDKAKISQFDTSKEAGVFLQNNIREGDIVLVKGSQGIRMEKMVEEIMLHPEEKENLLVRQEKAWRHR